MKNITKLYLIMTIGAAVGVAASFWQTLDVLALLKNPEAILVCNLSSVLSCSNVLNSPQASLFGFPNSIMSLGLFIVFLSVAMVGLTGGIVSKYMRFASQFLAIFTTGFAFWFLFQSTYSIQAICIFCLFSFAGLLLINFAWLRLNASSINWMKRLTKKGLDIFIWSVMAIIVASAIIFKFYI